MNRLKLAAVSVALFTSACGQQIVEFKQGAGGNVPPTVLSTIPVDGATGVALDTTVSAIFSKPMDPATISGTSFTLMQGAIALSGTVTYSAGTKTATFTPAAPLGANRVYTATITTGAKDTGGLALPTSSIWSFTTGTTSGPPMVDSTTPLDLSLNVSVNKRPTATFNKAMDPATINATTFTVMQGLNAIAGTVVLGSSNTAIFTPAAPLGLSSSYTATITTGAKDLAGMALASNYTWSFTTGACSQATVALGSAASFGALAGQSLTNTGLTTVTGDIGVSPGTSITGFGPGSVSGSTHAGDSVSAAAIADLNTAYLDAAGRSLCAVTVAGNLGGQTLTPGLYKSTSSLAISSGDLTLDAEGDGDAVFIFQMASTLTTTAGRQIFLTNGAKASNIFWQVGSSATIGTTSSFYGTIMSDQSTSLLTGATLEGRAMGHVMSVTLDSNTIVVPTP